MTGPEHYAEAEAELERANRSELGVESQYHHAKAQVHATLAQVHYLRKIGDQLDTLPRSKGRTAGLGPF